MDETPTLDSMWVQFRDQFGCDPDVVVRAPGRVNLIGEHTDTSDGLVMPVAIDRETWVAARRIEGPTQLVSREMGAGSPFETERAEPGEVEGWAQYAAGAAWALRHDGFETVPNVQAVLASNIPAGAGLSSSAALEVAFLHVWNALGGYQLKGTEIARLARLGENRFVGVGCGIMDPLASALGRPGHAMRIDTRNLQVAYSPIPEAWALVVCDTGAPRALAHSEYNARRLEVERATQVLGLTCLRDATLPLLEAARPTLDDTAYRRARHVVTENARVDAFAAALAREDGVAVGEAMRASHASLRDDFEVSCPELDAMVESATQAPGCIGVRMTGAGFGGACVALVEMHAVTAFMKETARDYVSPDRVTTSIFSVRSVAGAGLVRLESR